VDFRYYKLILVFFKCKMPAWTAERRATAVAGRMRRQGVFSNLPSSQAIRERGPAPPRAQRKKRRPKYAVYNTKTHTTIMLPKTTNKSPVVQDPGSKRLVKATNAKGMETGAYKYVKHLWSGGARRTRRRPGGNRRRSL
jgi:hypothetical protein